MTYTFKSKNIFALTVPALIFSFIILILPYAWGNYKKYGLTWGYLLFCFVIWFISLMLLHLEGRYILKSKNRQVILDKKSIHILLVTTIIITIWSIISVLTGYLISIPSTPSDVHGYLLGVILVFPALQYLATLLYFLNARKLLVGLLICNLPLIGGGFIWAVMQL